MNSKIRFIDASNESVRPMIEAHIRSLAFPFEGYVESMLDNCRKLAVLFQNLLIGYAGITDDFIDFFYVALPYFNIAPKALEQLTQETGIARIMVRTNDPMLLSLVSEWDYTTNKYACWFIDAGRIAQPDVPVKNAVFRKAELSDLDIIEENSDGFFDDDDLESWISGGWIYKLEQSGEHLGYGIINHEKYNPHTASIGMYCIKRHRRKGVAQTILWHLKEIVYARGRSPVAGCWYYNTLSRMSLERANLRVVGIGYIANLTGKEKLKKITGNPPGEIVPD